ncbi:UNVERIFIED_CONTAM: hypothetical protein FKN15_042622 [Acipenser sinensis]
MEESSADTDIETLIDEMDYIPGHFHLELNLNCESLTPAKLRRRDMVLKRDSLQSELESETGSQQFAVRNLLGLFAFHLEELSLAEETFLNICKEDPRNLNAWANLGYMRSLFVLAVLVLLSAARGEEGARLLASKSLLNRYAVEGKDLTLQYNIYNVGSSAGLEVELSDDSFPPEDFGIVSGMLNVKWDRIAPASNVSHTVVLRPLKAGYFNFTSATITYLAQEGGQVVVRTSLFLNGNQVLQCSCSSSHWC